MFSFLAACPGGYFRNHYFLQLLPAAGLLAGVAVRSASALLTRLQFPFYPAAMPFVVFVAIALGSLYQSRAVFFQLPMQQASRAIYTAEFFPESLEVSRYIKAHSPPNARIAVMGSEPQIYFYSQRRSATGYLYTYPLMEPQPYASAMQQEMIKEITAADPEYIVFINNPFSWAPYPGADQSILGWFNQYQKDRYQVVGLAQIITMDKTEYRWLEDGEIPAPTAKLWLAVFKNKKPQASGNLPPASK